MTLVGNVMRTASTADYPAYGFAMGVVDVLGSSNVVDGVDTLFFLIGGNASEMSSFHNTQVFHARVFRANDYAQGHYEQAFTFTEIQWNGRPYHPAVKPPTPLPVSGTSYQNLEAGPITVMQSVYAQSAGAPGTVHVALGPTPPPSPIYTRVVSSASQASAPDLVEIEVPSAYYYSFTVSDAVLGPLVAFRR